MLLAGSLQDQSNVIYVKILFFYKIYFKNKFNFFKKKEEDEERRTNDSLIAVLVQNCESSSRLLTKDSSYRRVIPYQNTMLLGRNQTNHVRYPSLIARLDLTTEVILSQDLRNNFLLLQPRTLR